MPRYDYDCPEHGTFESFNTLEDYRKKEECPRCGALSAKLISMGTRVNMRGLRGITSRTDIEMETKSVEESMREMSE